MTSMQMGMYNSLSIKVAPNKARVRESHNITIPHSLLNSTSICNPNYFTRFSTTSINAYLVRSPTLLYLWPFLLRLCTHNLPKVQPLVAASRLQLIFFLSYSSILTLDKDLLHWFREVDITASQSPQVLFIAYIKLPYVIKKK